MTLHFLLIHGYGVRSGFWDGFVQWAMGEGHTTTCVELDMLNVDSAITSCKGALLQLQLDQQQENTKTIAVGHSLGGIFLICTLARFPELAPNRAVAVASPIGTKNEGPHPLLRWLVRHKLVPGFIIRQRFFGKQVPDAIRKKLFSQAVREAPGIAELILPGTWFHTELLHGPYAWDALFMASMCDKIVPWQKSSQFAEACQAPFYCFNASFGFGHNDLGVSALVAETYATVMLHDLL